jgi:hypothetical protein
MFMGKTKARFPIGVGKDGKDKDEILNILV